MEKKVSRNDTVVIYFKGSTEDGFNFSSSGDEGEGFQVTLGEGSLLPIFESCLIGMTPGEVKLFKISREEGLPIREDLIFEVEREILPKNQDFQIDDDLLISLPSGEKMEVVIRNLTEDMILLDANPPFAGKELTVEMKLFDIL